MTTYNFLETKLPKDFAREKVIAMQELVEQGETFTVLGMPGEGVSSFLRFFATHTFAQFAFIDIYDLVRLSKLEYLRQILRNLGGTELPNDEQQVMDAIREKLLELSKSEKKVVIICNRFDQMSEKIDRSFLANLYQLSKVAPKKIVFIFTANIPLSELCPDAVSGYNLTFYSNSYYFGRYNPEDIKAIIKLNFPAIINNPKKFERALKLGNGHYQLTGMVLKSESSENPLLDKIVRLALSEIYESLNHHRKTSVQKIAQGKQLLEIDPYLIHIGIVDEVDGIQKLFTPLLADFVQGYVALKLPVKERKLFKLLQKKEGELVTKDELFHYIWTDDSESATDWALNALVYRLRKNPQLRNGGYEIISLKKQGYMLIKI